MTHGIANEKTEIQNNSKKENTMAQQTAHQIYKQLIAEGYHPYHASALANARAGVKA